MGIITDVTERTQAQHAVVESEARYRQLFEAARHGILILDAQAETVVDVNPFLLELTGYSRRDLLGLHLREIGPFKGRAESRAAFADLQAREYLRYEDLTMLGRGGQEIAVEFISNVYRVGEQDLIQRNVRDITARKQADINAVVRESGKLLRRALGENVELVTSLDPEPCLARCGPGQIEQVIFNLAINARDAMPRGGGRLTIETASVEVDDDLVALHRFMRVGPHVRLSVRDAGVGMGPEVKAHVFEPFFTTKPQGEGTGLGLATVYGIVNQSKGYVLLDSELGKGTTFAVYLPRTIDAVVAAPAVVPNSRRGAETVLVVEDDPLVQRVTVRSLVAAGYRVIVASGGREVAETLRRDRPHLRVLYMSGHAPDAISRAGVLDAGTEVLGKPFSASQIQERVRKVLDA